MGQLIKHFADGSFLEYDRGGFDDWCVYLTDASGKRKPPRDIDYFAQLRSLAERFGTDKVYNDYVKVYELTGKQVSKADLDCISRLSEEYGASANQVDTIFFFFFMAMIAEQRKAGTRLGKRIKRLGIHKLLIENIPVREAANFMRGI